ncbi:MAG TPA: heat-inducible transcriptional repressor HrcA, partial [Acidimicrobiia bacterium]|nr:heat-inducible transcriptional repressor HrcA [Acidimicrobiia bacterium]
MYRAALREQNDLDDRKAEILKTVIDIYLADPTPVASKIVGLKSGLGVSSATIRNEMHALEEEGYLAQTHTSSGRIPTDRGYRFFVDNFVAKQRQGVKYSDRKSVKRINEKLETLVPGSSPSLLDEMVVLISTLTQHTAVALRNSAKTSCISDVHVSVLNGRRLIVGLFFEDATVDRVVIDVAQFSLTVQREIEHYSDQIYVDKCEKILKSKLTGKRVADLVDLANVETMVDSFESQLLRLVEQDCKSGLHNSGVDSFVHVAGVSKIADIHDNSDPYNREISSKVLGLVEQHMRFVEVIRNSLSETIDARIGAENNLEELQRHSMILAPIRGPEGETGAVGIIGPTRMDYFKAFDC